MLFRSVELGDGEEEFVFCHNDLGQHNVIVDPETLKIKAIIDWEFSGFFPHWFEAPLWEKPGPAHPVGNEGKLREWLVKWCDEVSPEFMFYEDRDEVNENVRSKQHGRRRGLRR